MGGVKMLRIKCFILIMACVFFLSGCADIKAPTPETIIEDSIALNTLQLGMSKSKVISLYGEADQKRVVKSKLWNNEREEWFYKAQMDVLPVGTGGYLSKDLYLYFDGDSLTNISKKCLVPVSVENKK
ncbi:secreted protein [Candidatus Omnitrophus magneticus]|uniref:Secreted protein n=1 Tax=Candidatus Omnitrophus magneticus TaxID=1609969 RepID=A0A0F0CR07_9BACT|nr:secreted protein [Candidatus Omnitrophus magneticus]